MVVQKTLETKKNSIIGGVLSGISQYIGDPIWLEIIMAILWCSLELDYLSI
jgi:phage shock protein PspC (stress-responsive transcriptional regulator)